MKKEIEFFCPTCASPLKLNGDQEHCRNGHSFPIVDGIPILIDDQKSVFSQLDFQRKSETFFVEPQSKFRKFARLIIKKTLPDIMLSISAADNYSQLADLLRAKTNPLILVIGCGESPRWMENLISNPEFQFVETDVSMGPRVQVICDGHDLPFADRSFDAAVAQGVLEHVADSDRVVSEIHRVLKNDGYVFADSPFLAPGHFAPYDFRRFTIIGHRRLFRSFTLIAEGMSFGPAASLTWTIKAFAVALVPTRNLKAIAGFLVHLCFFWLKYLDYFLIKNREAYDAASGFYFLGQKSDVVLGDKEIVAQYSQRC